MLINDCSRWSGIRMFGVAVTLAGALAAGRLALVSPAMAQTPAEGAVPDGVSEASASTVSSAGDGPAATASTRTAGPAETPMSPQAAASASAQTAATNTVSPGSMGGSVAAQAAYRLGRQAQVSGRKGEAQRCFHEAIRLDPTFPEPHYALAASFLPLQAGTAASTFVDGLRAQWSTFRGQHRMVLNLSLFLLLIVVGSLTISSTLIAFKALEHFQHPVVEVIRKKFPGGPAALAAWIIVIQPVLWGMGLYLTLALALGLLWTYLNMGEKRIAGALLALSLLVPAAFHGLSRLTAPFNPESIPFLLSAASETPDLPGLGDALKRVSTSNPSNPEPHLALGLVAENHDDLRTAEAEYRKALELGGSPGRSANNLANVLQRTGRLDLAVENYLKAIAAEPNLAAPHFNLSQAYARRLQFDLVDHEMSRASQLDFEGMRGAMAQSTGTNRHLMSLGAAPSELWKATLHARAGQPLGIPRSLAWLYDGSLRLLPLFTLLLFGAGMLGGHRIRRFLPTYSCSNCGTVVCRKCLRRIRRRAYCVRCGDTVLSLKTSEFTRMLLDRRLHDEGWPGRVAHFLSILVIPGWEAVRRGRPLIGLSLVVVFMTTTLPVLLNGMPIKAVPSLQDVPDGGRWLFFAGALIVLYGLSALILRSLPEPESDLLETELGMASHGVPDRLDRVA